MPDTLYALQKRSLFPTKVAVQQMVLINDDYISFPPLMIEQHTGLGSKRGVFGPMSKISFTLSNYRFVIWDKNYRRYFVI